MCGTTLPVILSSSSRNHTVRVTHGHGIYPHIEPTTRTGRQSRVFEPTAFEIRFQHLSKVVEGPDQGSLVPVMERRPSPDDWPSFVLSVTFLSHCIVHEGDFTDVPPQAKRRRDAKQV